MYTCQSIDITANQYIDRASLDQLLYSEMIAAMKTTTI